MLYFNNEIKRMGINFDIIGKSNDIIDSYSLNWLVRNYNNNFISDNYHKTISSIILYCNEQINLLQLEQDNLNKIINLEKNKFEDKKRELSKLILLSENNDILNDIINNCNDMFNYGLSESNSLTDSITQINWHLNCFIRFKIFLEKYKDYNYEIYC